MRQKMSPTTPSLNTFKVLSKKQHRDEEETGESADSQVHFPAESHQQSSNKNFTGDGQEFHPITSEKSCGAAQVSVTDAPAQHTLRILWAGGGGFASKPNFILLYEPFNSHGFQATGSPKKIGKTSSCFKGSGSFLKSKNSSSDYSNSQVASKAVASLLVKIAV